MGEETVSIIKNNGGDAIAVYADVTNSGDVSNMIKYEDINNIILIGHSYGGMVITGVADKLPSRIKKLVYVDAFFPYNQESVFSITKRKPNKKDLEKGFIYPFWVSDDKKPPKDVPHPLKTFTDKLILKNPDRNKIPTHYILTYNNSTETSKKGVFAAGDIIRGASLVVWAIKDGRDAASSIKSYLENIELKKSKVA